MSSFDKIVETKRIGMSVKDAIMMCAKAVNESPKFTFEDIDEENGSVTCIYTYGLFKFNQQMGNVNRVTFVFSDDGNGGTICTGRIFNEYNEYNVNFLTKPIFHKILLAAMKLV